MISLSHLAASLRPAATGLFLAAMAAGAAPLHAQVAAPDATSARNNPAVATDGATLIHGNYCGAGNRPGRPPIDALDLACMNHDACTPTGGIPTCDCNARLRDEAAAVSNDPRQAPELRSLASLTAAAASMMLCKPTINANAPAAPAAPVERAPIAPAPVVQAPVNAAPVADAPVAQAPIAQAPVAQVPVAQAPIAQAPVAQAPVAEAPVAQATRGQVAAPPAPVEAAPVDPAPAAAPMSILPAGAAPTTRPLP